MYHYTVSNEATAHAKTPHYTLQICTCCCHVHAGEQSAEYAFVYPNLMLNRYGPWLDINIVEPTGSQTCQVRFEYFLHQDHEAGEKFVEESLQASDAVQQEDVRLCEAVQRGLRSPAYDTGRSVLVPAHLLSSL